MKLNYNRSLIVHLFHIFFVGSLFLYMGIHKNSAPSWITCFMVSCFDCCAIGATCSANLYILFNLFFLILYIAISYTYYLLYEFVSYYFKFV